MVVWRYAGFVGLCLLQTIWAEDAAFITMDCPAKFQDGKENEIKCTPLRAQAEIDKYCIFPPAKASFAIKRVGSEVDLTVCDTTSYPSQQADCTTRPTAGTCACTGFNDTTATFTFKYVGTSSTDTGARMTCSICGHKEQPVILRNHCEKMDFGGAGSVQSSVLGVLVSAIGAILLRNWTPPCL